MSLESMLHKLLLISTIGLVGCTSNNDESVTDTQSLQQDSVKVEEIQENPLDKCDLTSQITITKEDSTREALVQESFHELFAKEYSILYGDRLYTNKELLCPTFQPEDFNLTPFVRVRQYFLRNGRDATFEVARQLGATRHQTVLTENYSLTRIFEEAGIPIKGETLDWIEIPGGRSGGLIREKKYFGGEDEQIMIVGAYTGELGSWIHEPADSVGYKVDLEAEFKGTVANELSHEIHDKYFPSLFKGGEWTRLSEPFASFESEVPGLRFYNNAQAGEFLSDVADWIEGGVEGEGTYSRFFNPLFYMSPNAEFGNEPEDRYAYSYGVQRYAMEQVLKNKGYENPSQLVDELVEVAETSNFRNHGDAFRFARPHFQEEDFKEIANTYRRIGVELLKTMAPYYQSK